jgi:hypothetical protein
MKQLLLGIVGGIVGAGLVLVAVLLVMAARAGPARPAGTPPDWVCLRQVQGPNDRIPGRGVEEGP